MRREMTVRGWMGVLSAKRKRCPEDKKDQGAKGVIPAALRIVDPDHPSTILVNQAPSIHQPCIIIMPYADGYDYK